MVLTPILFIARCEQDSCVMDVSNSRSSYLWCIQFMSLKECCLLEHAQFLECADFLHSTLIILFCAATTVKVCSWSDPHLQLCAVEHYAKIQAGLVSELQPKGSKVQCTFRP